jgi:hypothetical protein
MHLRPVDTRVAHTGESRPAFSLFSPELSALGLVVPPATLRRVENPQGVRRSGRKSQAHTDSSGVFACRAAVASGVHPPEPRPSVSGATSDRRSAPPGSTAMMARSCSR